MPQPIQFTDDIVYNGGTNEALAPNKIKDNQWVSGENSEPMPDGVRMRKGYTKENTTQLPDVDSLHEGGTDSRAFVDGTSDYISQGFKISVTADFVAAEVRLKIHAGTPTATTRAAIWSDTGGVPDAVVTDLATGDFTNVAVADLTSDYKWFRFPVATPVSLTGGTQYHLVIQHTNSAVTDTASIEEVTTPSGYADGTVAITAFPSPSWTAQANADLNFRILTGKSTITGIKDYALSDAATEYHMVFAGQHLYKNTGAGLMIPVSQNPRVNEYVSSVDTHPSMVVANDRLMITDGTDPSQQFYLDSAVEYYENVGIKAPITTETVGTSAGNANDGTYFIDYFFYNSRTGQSSRRRYDGIKASEDVTASSHEVDITGLPSTAEGRTNDAATSIRIEAKGTGPALGSSGGSTSIYRLLADANGVPIDIAIGTTLYTITSINTYTVAAEYDDDVPPRHSFKIIAENRQFFGGDPTNPWRISYSKIAGGVPYYESVPSTNFRDFGRGDGDYLTAFAFMSPRTLIVGFKNSIHAIDARDPGVSDTLRIAKGVGIANHLSINVVGNTLYFVSDADEHKGMFKWRPGMAEPEHLTGIDNTFQDLKHSQLENCSSVFYAPDDNRHQWWTTVAGSGQTAQTKILVYDTILDAWTDYNIVANVLGLVEESSISNVYIGQSGDEHKGDSGSTDNGTIVKAMFKTKDHNFGQFGVRKKSRFIDYTALRKTTGSLLVVLDVDSGSGSGSNATLGFPSLGTAFVLGTSTLGSTAVLGGGTGDFTGREAVRALGRLIAYEYSSQTDFHLKTVSYGIQQTGRR